MGELVFVYNVFTNMTIQNGIIFLLGLAIAFHLMSSLEIDRAAKTQVRVELDKHTHTLVNLISNNPALLTIPDIQRSTDVVRVSVDNFGDNARDTRNRFESRCDTLEAQLRSISNITSEYAMECGGWMERISQTVDDTMKDVQRCVQLMVRYDGIVNTCTSDLKHAMTETQNLTLQMKGELDHINQQLMMRPAARRGKTPPRDPSLDS